MNEDWLVYLIVLPALVAFGCWFLWLLWWAIGGTAGIEVMDARSALRKAEAVRDAADCPTDDMLRTCSQAWERYRVALNPKGTAE